MRLLHMLRDLMSSRIRVGWTAFWQSVGDQGKSLISGAVTQSLIDKYFTLCRRTAWFTYKISVRLSFLHPLYTRLILYLSYLYGLDHIAIRGVPGAGSYRSYVFFVVLRRLQHRGGSHGSRRTGRCDRVFAVRLGRGLHHRGRQCWRQVSNLDLFWGKGDD